MKSIILAFGFFVSTVVNIVGKLGYLGIIFMMALESSFIPFPSEVVIPPAGYLVSLGKMNMSLVIICGIFGSMIGSSVNYYIACKYGRAFLLKFSRFLFLTPEKLNKIEIFFYSHGEITTFIGRLLPVIRQYISFPAGLAKMNFIKFLIFTGLGSSFWVVLLAYAGKVVGENSENIKSYVNKMLYYSIPFIIILLTFYLIFHIYKVRHKR